MIFAAGNMRCKLTKDSRSACRFDKSFNGKPLSNKNLYTLNRSDLSPQMASLQELWAGSCDAWISPFGSTSCVYMRPVEVGGVAC